MTIRRATAEDMESIYMMGIDAWGSDTTEQEYLQSCRSSEKYKLGTWYCLEKNNERLSSIIIYSGVFGLQEKYGGFGSISTNPMHRNKGYAGDLIADSIKRLEQEQYLGIFLFSEVGTSLYGKYGFCQVGGYEKDGLMFLGINGGSKTTAPSYF